MRSKILLLIVFFSLSSMANSQCHRIRAAFDIGSGGTKMKVAKVDTCSQVLIKILADEERAIGYKQALKESDDNTLNDQIVKKGIEAILELKKIAQKFKPHDYIGVATSAFRTASNGKIIARKIKTQTGIPVHIISQEQEAKIGFAGATVISGTDLKNTIVWDIGGGSMQITSYDGNGKYNIYQGKLASVSFKNHFIEEVKKKDIAKVKTPNPINKRQLKVGFRDASVYAKISVPAELKKLLKKTEVQVIGIGGVHYHAISKSIDQKSYNLQDLKKYIKKLLYLKDKEIGDDPYVDTKVTNFILVAGFMDGLNITQVTAGKINMANGLLIAPELATP